MLWRRGRNGGYRDCWKSHPTGRFRPSLLEKEARMPDQEQAELRMQFARLKQDHADFDAAIEAMIKTGCEPLQIQRMKKKKLALRDLMQKVEDQIIPDIIA